MIAYRDKYIYSADEMVIKRAALRLMKEGYTYAELMHLMERVLIAELICTRKMQVKSIAKLLGMTEANIRDIRDSMDFEIYTDTRPSKQVKVAQAKEKVEDLQRKVLRRLEREKGQGV